LKQPINDQLDALTGMCGGIPSRSVRAFGVGVVARAV